MEKDYEKDGKLKAGAKLKTRPVSSLYDLDKHTNFDPNSWAELVAYKKRLQQAYENKMKDCR